jgi:hypothetical protein
MIVFRFTFWPVVAFMVAFGLLCLRLGHHWVRVRCAWLGRLAGATYQQRRGQNRARDQAAIQRSLRGTGARLFAEGWRDAVPMLFGDEGIA